MSAGDNLQPLAHLGVTDRHISADAKSVARVGQTTFDTYLAQEDEPTLKGLFRSASTEQGPSAAADAMNIDIESTSTEWYTPPEVFRAIAAEFDVDVASPGKKVVPWIPAKEHYTKQDDGLAQNWHGFVWMNAPFGLRNGMLDWIEKFIHHGNGVALVPDFTSTAWWQKLAAHSDCILSISPKLQFLPKRDVGINTLGSTLVAIGEKGVLALQSAERNGLGVCFLRKLPGHSRVADTSLSTRDNVYTSPELAARIVEYFQPSGFCVDACAGRFAFYNALPNPKDWCELPDRDFLTYDFGRRVDWLITNPPFSAAYVDIAARAFAVAEHVVFLVKLNVALGTYARHRAWREAGHGLKEIIYIPWADAGFVTEDDAEKSPEGFVLAALHWQRGWKGDVQQTYWTDQSGRLAEAAD